MTSFFTGLTLYFLHRPPYRLLMEGALLSGLWRQYHDQMLKFNYSSWQWLSDVGWGFTKCRYIDCRVSCGLSYECVHVCLYCRWWSCAAFGRCSSV